MERTPDLRYFVEKCVRQGTATYTELFEVSEQYGAEFADVLAEELNAKEVQFVGGQDVVISSQTNVLMNDLRLVELVSLALRLPVVPKIRRRLHKNVIQQQSYELSLKRLDYLDSDYEWYYLSPSFNRLQRAIRRLFDSGQIPFAKEWRSKRENLRYLEGLIVHPVFTERIASKIREHYLGLREVKFLMCWIEATEKLAPVMTDIVQVGLREHGSRLVRGVLFSNQASTADSALRRRQDVCFSCLPGRKCLPLRNIADPYDVLMEYRHSDLDTLLRTRYPNLTVDECLMKDQLMVKFFVPYSIVVSTKKFMTEICCLSSSTPILRKNAGKYCPYYDNWPLAQLT